MYYNNIYFLFPYLMLTQSANLYRSVLDFQATRIVLDIILFFDRIYRIDFYPVTKYLINKTVQLMTGSRFSYY